MRKSDVVFFLSGAAALGYETAWARLLARVLGSSAPAAAIVLAVFMGGMGVGALAFAGWARRTRDPVRMFAVVEVAIAAWAAITPFVLAHLHPVASFAVRALDAAAILLVPTVLLGATFPLMARLTIRTSAETGSETSAFYGANTIGAAVGALLGPFVLMPRFGLSGAVYASAALDVAAAIAAFALLRTASVETPAGEKLDVRGAETPRNQVGAPSSDGAESPTWREPLLIAACVFGASSLALEVLLLRLLVTVTGASVYAFALITAVFLLGIGLGARQLAERRTRTGVPEGTLAERGQKSRDALVWCGLAIPLLALAGLLALRFQLGEADLFGGLENRVPQGVSVLRVWLGHALFAGLSLLPPAIAFGIALPSAASALVARRPDDAREHTLGLVYAWNTAGALIGSLAAGFVLLPHLGPRVSVAIAIALPWLAVLWVDRARLQIAMLAGIAALAVGWIVLAPAKDQSGRTVLVLAHDAHTTALVEETQAVGGPKVRSLRVNGKPEASTALVDERLQYLLGHIPGLLAGNVRRALVIGLGTGMTSGSLLDLPGIENVRIVEISHAVARCAREFGQWNGHVLDDPRTDLRFGDGRNALATSDERFDLITSDPVHPWTRGSSDLYTLEHFTTMRAHLETNGVASQWLPLYELSTEDVKTIVATWCAAFPRVSAWLTAYDLVLIGSNGPLAHESDLIGQPLPPRVIEHDDALGVHSAIDLAALQVVDDTALRALVIGVEPMHDDRPVIEFRAPLSSLSGYSTDILRWAIRPEFVASIPAPARPAAVRFRSKVSSFLERLPNGFTAAADQLGDQLRMGALSTAKNDRDDLAMRTREEDALAKQLIEAERDPIDRVRFDTLSAQHHEAVARTDALASTTFTPEEVAKSPSLDLLADEGAWERSDFKSWQIRNGVLSAVGPEPGSDRLAVMDIGDPDAWHDVVLDMEATLEQGRARLYLRLSPRAAIWIRKAGTNPEAKLEDVGPMPVEFRFTARREDLDTDYFATAIPVLLDPRRSYLVAGSVIGSSARMQVAEEEPITDPNPGGVRARVGRIGIGLPAGSAIRITRMRIKVLR